MEDLLAVLCAPLDRVRKSFQQYGLSCSSIGFVVALVKLALWTGGIHRREPVFVIYVFVGHKLLNKKPNYLIQKDD